MAIYSIVPRMVDRRLYYLRMILTNLAWFELKLFETEIFGTFVRVSILRTNSLHWGVHLTAFLFHYPKQESDSEKYF